MDDLGERMLGVFSGLGVDAQSGGHIPNMCRELQGDNWAEFHFDHHTAGGKKKWGNDRMRVESQVCPSRLLAMDTMTTTISSSRDHVTRS